MQSTLNGFAHDIMSCICDVIIIPGNKNMASLTKLFKPCKLFHLKEKVRAFKLLLEVIICFWI